MGVTTIWDNKWYGETKRYKGKWTVEMQIPFKSIRFKGNLATWRINFSRNDLGTNENTCWVKVPRQFNISTLAFAGDLVFEKEPPKKSGSNTSVIPYGIGRFSEDYKIPGSQKIDGSVGADAKMVLGSSLNLDMTINPDFSQVEVDRQLTNLTRFSLFFPEQRQFFIENSDLFDRFGFRQIRPFFSRRIGLDNGNIIPILGGVRLSGKPSKNWRIGILDMQTGERSFSTRKVFSQNYFTAAAQYNVFKRSNIAAIFVNRQQFDTSGYSDNNYNRVFGLDYNLASASNRWNGKFFFHHSLGSKNNSNAFTHASWLNYSSRHWTVEWNHEYVDKNYNAEVGFTPRIFQADQAGKLNRFTYWRLEPHLYYYSFPKNGFINKIGHTINLDHYRNQAFKNTDWLMKGSYDLYFKSSAFLSFIANAYYTKLLFPTDVSFSGKPQTTASGDYLYQNAGVNIRSDVRKTFTGGVTATYGSYFTGNKFSMVADLTYRLQPYLIFSASYTRDEIYLPYLSKKVELDLISPRIELSVSRSLFLTTFWQYNTQANNINFNGKVAMAFQTNE
ncbi:MAG: hydrolase [Sphingobacteriaceae bacterium]|nr:hydrolase [Sphingobacteriaceae bacterium]